MTPPRPVSPIASSLLARKGEARPAMRPHGGGPGDDDLGWNDLGLPETVPPVLRQRAQLHALASPAAGDGVTLHLDTDRLWRLRLAAAIRNVGPDAILTQALDRFLATVPEVDALVRRLTDTGTEGSTS